MPLDPLADPAPGPSDAAASGAWSALYHAHAARVHRWAAHLAGPGVDVEDIVHEVFLVAFRRIDGFRGESSVPTWLYGITRKVVSHQRRKQRWRRWLRGSAQEAAGELPSAGPWTDEALQVRRAAQALYAGLDRLSEGHRTVLVMFELEGLSGEEIARTLGISVSAVWVRLHRGRARLAEVLGDSGGALGAAAAPHPGAAGTAGSGGTR